MHVIPIPSNDYPSKLASISPTSVCKGNTHDDALACIELHAWYARQIRKEIAMDKEKVSLRRDSREASRPGRWLPATEEAIEEVTTGERFWIMSHVKWMLGNCQPVQLRLHINEWPTHRPTVQRLSHAYTGLDNRLDRFDGSDENYLIGYYATYQRAFTSSSVVWRGIANGTTLIHCHIETTFTTLRNARCDYKRLAAPRREIAVRLLASRGSVSRLRGWDGPRI